MPQDSVYVNNDSLDLEKLKDSLQGVLITPAKSEIAKHEGNEGLGMAITIYLSIILAVIVVPIFVRYVRSMLMRKKLVKDYEAKEVVFDNILHHYNPYYKSLTNEGQARFMRRTIEFMGSKNFQYIDVEQEEMMPLLISAAAVQLTFGLKNYMLDYFNTIYVLRDNYRYGLYNMPFQGHVSEDGIYLSWNNFIKEYNDYSDGQNVGLHELAHALTYVNFNAEDGVDEVFHDKFKDFSKVARPLFERMQAGESNLLDKYAATNYEEFWAVSVETFFERPEEFRKQLPGLYFALCHLLNQDPLTPRKIISLTENV